MPQPQPQTTLPNQTEALRPASHPTSQQRPVSQSHHLNHLIAHPPLPGLDTLNRAVFAGSNTTPILKDGMTHAQLQLTNSIAAHKDLWSQADFRAVADEAEKLNHQVARLCGAGISIARTGEAESHEKQRRDKYKQLIMQAVRLKKRVEHTAVEIRSRMAKEKAVEDGGKEE